MLGAQGRTLHAYPYLLSPSQPTSCSRASQLPLSAPNACSPAFGRWRDWSQAPSPDGAPHSWQELPTGPCGAGVLSKGPLAPAVCGGAVWGQGCGSLYQADCLAAGTNQAGVHLRASLPSGCRSAGARPPGPLSSPGEPRPGRPQEGTAPRDSADVRVFRVCAELSPALGHPGEPRPQPRALAAQEHPQGSPTPILPARPSRDPKRQLGDPLRRRSFPPCSSSPSPPLTPMPRPPLPASVGGSSPNPRPFTVRPRPSRPCPRTSPFTHRRLLSSPPRPASSQLGSAPHSIPLAADIFLVYIYLSRAAALVGERAGAGGGPAFWPAIGRGRYLWLSILLPSLAPPRRRSVAGRRAAGTAGTGLRWPAFSALVVSAAPILIHCRAAERRREPARGVRRLSPWGGRPPWRPWIS